MQPKRNGPQGKKSITDEIDKLRQRREDRKTKEDRKAQIGNPSQDSNKVMDIEYEKMILKKKNEIFQIAGGVGSVNAVIRDCCGGCP